MATQYSVPLATTTSVGAVKPDGVTITINNGVISAASSGSFVSPTLTGVTTVRAITEVITPISGASGTNVTHDLSLGTIFYHTNVASSFTAAFTNVPTTQGRSYLVTIIIQQGSTPYIPNAININGVSQNLYWNNNEQPFGTANKRDVFTFNLMNVNGSWNITASLTSFG